MKILQSFSCMLFVVVLSMINVYGAETDSSWRDSEGCVLQSGDLNENENDYEFFKKFYSDESNTTTESLNGDNELSVGQSSKPEYSTFFDEQIFCSRGDGDDHHEHDTSIQQHCTCILAAGGGDLKRDDLYSYTAPDSSSIPHQLSAWIVLHMGNDTQDRTTWHRDSGRDAQDDADWKATDDALTQDYVWIKNKITSWVEKK
jgi:hypothetical protein